MLYRRYFGHQDFIGMTPRRYAHIPQNQTGEKLSKDILHQADKIWHKTKKGVDYVVINMSTWRVAKHISAPTRRPVVKWRLYYKMSDVGPYNIDFDSVGISIYNNDDNTRVDHFVDHRSLYLTSALEDYSIEGFPLSMPERIR